MVKPKRFFYHYNKHEKCMSVHFNKQCIRVNNIKCSVSTNTKWNKIQPHLVIQGFCSNVDIVTDKEGNTTANII